MLLVVGEFRLPLENREAGLTAMARVVAKTRAEAGCLAYAYAEDVLDPGLFRVTEAWESREALAAHFAAPHMDAWRHEREGLGMTGRRIVAYTVAGEEAL